MNNASSMTPHGEESPKTTRTGKRTIIVVVAIVVTVALAVGVYWIWPKPLDTSHTRVEISSSSKFTPEQLHDLVQASYKENAGMKNCSVDKVKYDEHESEQVIDQEIDADAKGYGSVLGGAVRQHGRDGAAVLFVDMTCREPVDDEDHVESYMYLPQPDGTKAWVLQDWGNW